jgi:L-serine dehydratase
MISVFNIYSIGLGPSSSHTLGPMRIALAFVAALKAKGDLTKVDRVQVDLYGSLALTGKAHGTHKAVLLGLAGHCPETIDSAQVPAILQAIKADQRIALDGDKTIVFDGDRDLLEHREKALPKHANGMTMAAWCDGALLWQETYYSIGGGFVVTGDQFGMETKQRHEVPYPFHSAADLWSHARAQGTTIADIVLANEKVCRNDIEIRQKLLHLAEEMYACIDRGCQTSGRLPGGLQVKRRAYDLQQLLVGKQTKDFSYQDTMCWLNMCAMAVNEENAAGGKIITSPTNGAAGILPAVLNYFRFFCEGYSDDTVADFLLTAGAIAILYKQQASISGAEMGCQGEVGVASSMAAGALAAVLGGSLAQVENAAEIAMEHNLGLTCDPVGGLVQIPCIERNAMGAVKAVNAAYLALAGDGEHKVSLDKVIVTMRQTGHDMMTIYKETSLGGLAVTVNIPEC